MAIHSHGRQRAACGRDDDDDDGGAGIELTTAWSVQAGYDHQWSPSLNTSLFAGYSNIVIGTARVFGITLRENFRDPFLSTSPAEFWTRWHMSLSSWIRDYVFMPLATWRPQVWWRHASLVIAMLLLF